MNHAAFVASLAHGDPPAGIDAPLAAMWWCAKGDWNRAHELAQSDASPSSSWVHAHLHRVEGDLANAGYWYRRAGRPAADGALSAEWDAVVDELLRRRA